MSAGDRPDEERPDSGFPEPPGRDSGDRSEDPEPHHALNNPVEDPDETEYPDPYDKPHPAQDPQAEPWEGPKRDRVDD
jgi:hypothetical protein